MKWDYTHTHTLRFATKPILNKWETDRLLSCSPRDTIHNSSVAVRSVFVLTCCWRLEAEVNPDCWERWKITGNNSDDTKTQVCCLRCTYGSDVTPLCCSSNNRSYRSLKIHFCNVAQTYIVPPCTTCTTVHSCSKGAWKLDPDLISGLSGFINPIYCWSNMFSANVFSIPLYNVYWAPGHATQTSTIINQRAGTYQ